MPMQDFQTRLLDPVGKPYSPTDYASVRQRILDNTRSAMTQRFPIENESYKLEAFDLDYDPYVPTLKDEKKAILANGSVTAKLRGKWRLINKETGETQESKPRVMMNVPWMTERGTFIRNGSEKSINYMFRLSPGVYSRKKDNGMFEAHVNPKQGTGGQFKIELDPKSGVFRVKQGTRGYKLYTLLKRAGVTDDQMKKSWGPQMLDVNRRATDILHPTQTYTGGIPKVAADKSADYDALLEKLMKTELDPVSTEITLGRAHPMLTPETLLEGSGKVLKLSRGEAEEDYRDGLEFQKIDGPADYFAERIIRDGGGLAQGLLWRASRKGSLDDIPPAPLNKHVDSIFNESNHAGYIDGSSLFSAIDLSTRISRIGEGGISGSRTAPSETRAVQDSFAGFIDPVRSVESTRVGLDMYLGSGVRKGDDGRLYTEMMNAKTGKKEWVDSLTAAKSKVATKAEHDSEGKFIPAMHGSKGIKIVPKKDVDYYIMDTSKMFSIGANSVPGKSGIMANRLHMGGKYGTQSMPLVHREAPLVRGAQGGGVQEEQLGALLGVRKADFEGRVLKVSKDSVTVGSPKGETKTYELYDNFPFNSKGYLRSIPKVKVGDEVKKGKVLATTNFTDDKGVAAQGRNLRVAYMNWKGHTFEDAIALSETGAKKLAAEKMYKNRLPVSTNTVFDKKEFMGKFSSKYTKAQMDAIGPDGIAKPGTVLHKGDPLIVAVRHNEPKPGSLGRRTRTDISDVWNHDYEGVVVESMKGDKHATVYTRANVPMKTGDKMCYADDTEILTDSGWCCVAELQPGMIVASLNPDTHGIEYVPVSDVHVYDHKGRMHSVETTQVSLCTTEEHKQYARRRGQDKYELASSADLFGKRYRLLKNGVWKGTHRDSFKLPDVYNTLPQGKGKCVPTLVEGPEIPMEQYLTIMGIYLSDGNVVWQEKTSDYGFDITQIKGDNPRILREAFDRLGIKWCECSKGTKIRVYSKHWATYLRQFGKAPEKYFPEEILSLPPAQLAVFYEWFMFGDGHRTQSGHGITTSSYRMAGDWQRLCLHLGMSATIKRHKHKETFIKGRRICSDRPYYKVSTYREKNSPTINHGHSKTQTGQQEEWTDYSGKVYCPELQVNHIVYTRRNGKTVWSGNSSRYAAKGVVNVLPDSEMPLDKDGKPMDLILSSLGVISRVNPSQVVEAMAGKVARHTGKPEVLEGFEGDMIDKYDKKLRENGLTPTETLYDPRTGRKIPEVLTGEAFYYRLMHMSEDKGSGRGVGSSTGEEVPSRGGKGGAPFIGGLHASALVSHNAMQVLKDAKLIRGQANDDFWRDFRMGKMPKMPGTPLVNNKFYAHLKGAGINIEENADRVHFFGMTNEQARKMGQGHELQVARTYNQKNMSPIDGGLFDPKLFGQNGNDWGFIQLDEPLPNPVMEPAIASVLGVTQKKFNEVMAGEDELNGKKGGEAVADALGKLDMASEVKSALIDLKTASPSKKDKALKRYRFLKSMEEQGVHPKEFMMDRIPVLPPKFRPVTQLDGTNITADANIMYRSLMFARDDLRQAKERLPGKMLDKARKKIYSNYKALTGMYNPDDEKLQEKNVQGLMKWVFGKKGSKYGAYNRRVLGTAQNIAGRGVVVPNPSMPLNKMGIPIKNAWKVFEPFVVRNMVRAGHTPLNAIRLVKDQDPKAESFLRDAVKERPVIVNRAPTLHKYGVMAFEPVLVKGSSVQVSPSIVGPYGMDFDGDTVTYYAPVSKKAVDEARAKMMPEQNLISPRDMTAQYKPQNEFVQGLYLATRAPKGQAKKSFRTVDEAQGAYNKGEIDIDTPIVILET